MPEPVMTSQLRIDRLAAEDAGELFTLRLAASVLEKGVSHDGADALTSGLPKVRAQLVDPAIITLGAWRGYRLVGSLMLSIEGARARRGNFVVAPDLQGQGIGMSILKAGADFLPVTVSEISVLTHEGKEQPLIPITDHHHHPEFDSHTAEITMAYLRRLHQN
jgi:GNAT superfamily N-acetyltransferase